MEEFEGTFLSGEGMSSQFYVRNGKLHMSISGMLETVLEPIGNDQFLFSMREMDVTIRFLRDVDNNIHRVALASRQIPKVEEHEGGTN